VRVFLDTNVLVSAFATRGLCADLFELVLLEHDLVVGRQVMRELNRVLRAKLRLPPVQVAEIIEFVTAEAANFVEQAAPVDAAVSPADARVLGEALAVEAELFVTGDVALLKLGAIRGMRIVTPRRFWEHLRSPQK